MVRPKTHTRDSSRGMLTLTEEEASRRSGGSPAQSPCHSLPSGRPRRRESEPIGPQRPVRDSAGQSEESLALQLHVGEQMRKRTPAVQIHLSDDVMRRSSAAAAPPHLSVSQQTAKRTNPAPAHSVVCLPLVSVIILQAERLKCNCSCTEVPSCLSFITMMSRLCSDTSETLSV